MIFLGVSMSSIHFDFVDLRLFVYIAEENSLTRGAQRIHISLPAASMRIKKLEESIGIPLFERTATGINLLPAGEAFLHHAQQVLAQVELLRSDLQEYANGIIGHVRIFANTTAMTEFLPNILSRYLTEHPQVHIHLNEKPSADITRAVAARTTDIGIVADTVSTEGLMTLPFINDELVLAVNPQHFLAHQQRVHFEDTLGENYISLHEGSAIHTFLQQAAQRFNQQIKLRIQVNSFEALCRMVAENVGIGLLPDSAARRYAQYIDIKRIYLHDEWAKRNLLICVRDIESLPHYTKELIELLTE